jgi:hypothetical protein
MPFSRAPLKRMRPEPPVCRGFIIDLSTLSFRNVRGAGGSRVTAPAVGIDARKAKKIR